LQKNAKENEPTLSDTEVGDILVKAQQLKKWVKDLEDYALNALLNDKEIQGWKAVEGRGSRNWTSDTDAIIQRLGSLNYPSDIAYERKTLSVAQLEKIIGTTDFTNFSDLYEKTKGKPTLVPMSDKRSSYTQGTSANEDFKNN
jgi:hypothetical protein